MIPADCVTPGQTKKPETLDCLLDTSFLIGLWRQPVTGPESRFLGNQEGLALGLPWVVRAEFLIGSVIARHDMARVAVFFDAFPMVWADEDILLCYARAQAALRAAKLTVGANDLWIAAAALRHDLPVLTRNLKDFGRVEGLKLLDYTLA